MDPKEYPFVRGTGCDTPWNEVEKKGSSQNRGGNWYQPTSLTLVV